MKTQIIAKYINPINHERAEIFVKARIDKTYDVVIIELEPFRHQGYYNVCLKEVKTYIQMLVAELEGNGYIKDEE